jgi:hypothetical protein
MSTCWHGKEGVCEICYLIIGDGHLRAVERNGNGKGKNDESESSGDNETEGISQGT